MTLPSIGDVVDDKFRIERKLGEGGTSTIYEVRHAITEKQFAIKWLSPNLAKNDLAVQLLVHEAKVCGRFVHPNAVQIYDICRTEDSYYLLMEFLEGESLETRLHREERMSPQAACDILLPCIEALGAAHRAGIVHRDLKPSNIFLCRIEGRAEVLPKVLDFGISNFLHNGIEISPNSAGSGTPLYMAPEQMQAQPADPRFDIYALGVVLYELVSGRPPFDSDDFDDLVHRVVESQPTRLDGLVQVDSGFADIVSRAMARGVEDRFASMDDFAEALRPYSSHHSSAFVTPASPSQPPSPVVQGRREEPSRPPGRRSSWAQTSQGFMFRQDMAAALASEPPSPAVAAAAAAAAAAATAAGLAPTAAALAEPVKPTAAAVVTASAADPERTLEDIAVIGAVALDLEPEPVKPVAAPVASPAAKPQLLHKERKAQKLVAGASSAVMPQNGRTRDDTLVGPQALERAGLGFVEAAPVTPPPAAASAPPIVLPPARGALSLGDEIFWKDAAFGEDTPLRADDVPHDIPRLPRKRQIGLGLTAAFVGALIITLYTLARPTQAPQAPAESTLARTAAAPAPDMAPPPVIEAPGAAAPVEVAAAPAELARLARAAESEPRVAPKLDATPERSAKQTEAAIARAERRAARAAANAAKRAAATSDNPKPKRLATSAGAENNARAERSGSSDSARHGLSLPAAYVSRQDF